MLTVAIVGSSSYLASGIQVYLKDCKIIEISHSDIHKSRHLFEEADVVVNFGLSPYFSLRDMQLEEIIDVQIAKIISSLSNRFIFISSRKVYGSSDLLHIHSEKSPLNPCDFYSRNKIVTEKALSNILGNKLTILRVSNILGEPPIRQNYRVFMGWISLNYLSKGRLFVNQDPKTIKDFIPKSFFQDVLSGFIKRNIPGIFNVSSCCRIGLGELLEEIVGKDNVTYEPHTKVKDQFLLDNARLRKALGVKITTEDILNECRIIHSQLARLEALKS